MTDDMADAETEVIVRFNSPSGSDQTISYTTDDAPLAAMDDAASLVPSGSIVEEVTLRRIRDDE